MRNVNPTNTKLDFASIKYRSGKTFAIMSIARSNNNIITKNFIVFTAKMEIQMIT